MKRVTVEVVLAFPERQSVRRVDLPAGSTVGDAVVASGLQAPAPARFGVYGKAVPAATVVREGDRVEIYRSPLASTREMRPPNE